MAHEYSSSAELKATLELTGETFADGDIDLALTAASRAIDNATGRRFWVDTDVNQVRYYSPTSDHILWIDDLVTLTELAVDSNGDGTFEQIWTTNVDFVLEPLNAVADGWPWTTLKTTRRTSLYFPDCYERSVRVTGKFGWSAIPDTIEQATKIVASKLIKRSREAPFGVVSLGIDGNAVRIASNDPDVQMLIGNYVRETH